MNKPKRGGARKDSGIKTERQEPLVRLEVKVYTDQLAHVKKAGNASGHVRKLIDADMKCAKL